MISLLFDMRPTLTSLIPDIIEFKIRTKVVVLICIISFLEFICSIMYITLVTNSLCFFVILFVRFIITMNGIIYFICEKYLLPIQENDIN